MIFMKEKITVSAFICSTNAQENAQLRREVLQDEEKLLHKIESLISNSSKLGGEKSDLMKTWLIAFILQILIK